MTATSIALLGAGGKMDDKIDVGAKPPPVCRRYILYSLVRQSRIPVRRSFEASYRATHSIPGIAQRCAQHASDKPGSAGDEDGLSHRLAN